MAVMSEEAVVVTREADQLPVPGPSPETEAQKRRELRRHKAFATSLLVIATVIYFGCRWLETEASSVGEQPAAWIGYVRAASEAGMVGALADWFAVTALFRHPMGIPIPHTAIIRRKKDQVGEALSEFVGTNFLNPALIVDKVRQAGIPERIGEWTAEPGNAERVSAEVGKFVGNAVEAIDTEDAETLIRASIIDRLAAPEWGPPAGRLLQQLIADGKTEPIVQELAEWLYRKVVTSEDLIDRMVGDRSPNWAPRFVKDIVGERVHRELVDWAWEVKSDPDHEARIALRAGLDKLASDLQTDPTTMEKVEEIKQDILGSRPIVEAPRKIWEATSAGIIEQARDPESLIRRRIVTSVLEYGRRLREDQELRQTVEHRIEGGVRFFAENYSGEVTSIISETIERWDADEASERIELMVGKDLQFIRVNGTVVGSLAGLTIYTVSNVLFGG